MTEKVTVIVAPQLGVNDDIATLVQWYVANDDAVAAGQPICELETSKATFDVEADAKGQIALLVEVGTEVAINQPIALIAPSVQSLRSETPRFMRDTQIKSTEIGKPSGDGTGKATQKAREMASRLGVDLSDITSSEIIRERDVVRFHQELNGERRNEEIDISWPENSQPVVIYGAGKGAVTLKECLDLHDAFTVVCFVDDDPNHPSSLCDLPVYQGVHLEKIVERGVRSLACAIAQSEVRLRILNQCDRLGIELINVIHPRAYVAPTARLGRGNFIKSGAVIDTNTVIGDCCIIDNGAMIPHDNIVEDGCHIAPGASLGSSINIGRQCIIGIGASIATGANIGQGTILSVGCSVVQDIPEYSVVSGVPGKVVGKRKAPG